MKFTTQYEKHWPSVMVPSEIGTLLVVGQSMTEAEIHSEESLGPVVLRGIEYDVKMRASRPNADSPFDRPRAPNGVYLPSVLNVYRMDYQPVSTPAQKRIAEVLVDAVNRVESLFPLFWQDAQRERLRRDLALAESQVAAARLALSEGQRKRDDFTARLFFLDQLFEG